jgi:hypothetical protein
MARKRWQRIPPVKWLTADQERLAREAFKAGATRDEAAFLAGITRRLLDTRLRDQLADVRPGRGRGGGKKNREPPTPDEIEQMTELIRSRWDDETRRIRRLGPGRNFTGTKREG